MPSAADVVKEIPHLYEVKQRHGAEEMDELRQKDIAYQYLCHLEEAKKWMEAILHEELPPTMDLEEGLRNGVYLAKLAHFTSPETVPLSRIYDPEQRRYKVAGLQFRHTDNINYWLATLESIKLPKTFQPETTDVYDKKNMPRVIYCLHALSTHLFRLGKAPLMSDLYGQVHFTDEEINAVSLELRQYGIQMPAFQKIGGLLANEVPVDKAALHAAVIAINDALDGEDTEKVLNTLQNPTACLNGINPLFAEHYHRTMQAAKQTKVSITQNKSLNDSYTADVYDELLTQAEIQGHISAVNVLQAWREVQSAVRKKDEKALLAALRAKPLALKAVEQQCAGLYLSELTEKLSGEVQNNFIDSLECRLLLQRSITEGNKRAHEQVKSVEAVWQVNQALSRGGPVDTLRALQNPALGLHEVITDAAPLYHEEMSADKVESGRDLSLLEIRSCIHLLSKVAGVTQAVDMRSQDYTWDALSKFEGMIDVDQGLKEQYYRALSKFRAKKRSENASCPLLTFFDVHDCISDVHSKVDQQNLMVTSVHTLNKAVKNKNKTEMMRALQALATGLGEKVEQHEAPLYLKLLQEILSQKGKDCDELWLQDAQLALKNARKQAFEANKACMCLVRLHRAMDGHDSQTVLEVLQSATLHNTPVYPELTNSYIKLLLQCQKQKVAKGYKCPYVVHRPSNGNHVYLNLKNGTFEWEEPASGLDKAPFLSLREAEKLVSMVNSEMAASETEQEVENVVDPEQQKLLDLIIKIQSWWRGILVRKRVSHLLQKHHTSSGHQEPLQKYRQHVKEIILIQSLWRGLKARQVFQSLVHQPSPTIAIVRHFVSLLSPSTADFEKETQIQKLKSQVVKSIRLNQQLSQHIDDMDIKIGLLIQNRISLQDVQAHSVNLSDLANQHRSSENINSVGNVAVSGTMSKGLKSLTKEGRHLLEGYQNLFYLLQTRPQYLSKLLFCLPHSKSMHFLQNVIFSLYNFGSNPRDEYLLLKLLRSALEEEIRSKFQKPIDVLKVYPQVLKIAVNYSRQHSGQNSLRSILGPLVQKVLNDKTLSIDTNPVDIYKSWINQMETSTGQQSELPRVVSQEAALQHEEVQQRLALGISALKNKTLEFLERICSSRDQLPYSLLYTARTLHNALSKRFPGFPEKDLLKVIGNVVYYHFINAAIVAPDAYDIVTLPAEKTLTVEERSNLASIAKILQYAASKKGFGEESSHLKELNPFIIECHEKFKKFLKHCCQVEELEDHFGVHAYTEATLIVKPTILISLQELLETHQLVLQYEDEIASSPADPLHELLEGLGPISAVRKLLGGSSAENFMPKGELFLTLSNSKLEVASSNGNFEEPDQSQLFMMSKELLVSILPFLSGSDLHLALDSLETPAQDQQFAQQQLAQHRGDHPAPSTSLRLSKMRLQLWLSQLERQGLVSAKDNYQALVSAVARDICTRGQYCQARSKELQTLKVTMQGLETKTKFYQKQVEFYNMYIRTCLENLDRGKKRVHRLRVSGKHPGKAKSQKVLRYSAAQLHAKGVLHQMRGLTPAQFKSVQFEISPTESVGVFEVKGCFMGIEMERADIDIQHLLQMQYEGQAIMDMFGKVQINVNLLLFLLNKKFYGKS